nr:MAG TPA: hypothetical protein [Caudoviricetes sp.]
MRFRNLFKSVKRWRKYRKCYKERKIFRRYSL